MRHILAGFLAGAVLALASGAVLAETYRDWNVACEHDAGCSASTGGGTAPTLALDRIQGESGWFARIDFPAPVADPKRPLTLVIDGQRIVLQPNRDYVMTGSQGRVFVTGDDALRQRLMKALLAGGSLQLVYIDVTGEPRTPELSLAGLAASMLAIEERQGLLGSRRVLVAPEGIEAADPAARDESIEAAGVPEPVLSWHLQTSQCEDPESEHMRAIEPITTSLSETAILYAIPCTVGAYNAAYRLYVRETGEIGGIQTLYFATYSEDYGWGGTDLLFNIDADGQKLSAFYKGRGTGDCGTLGEWTWVDYAYRLDRFAAQDECDGTPPENWPVVYPPGG